MTKNKPNILYLGYSGFPYGLAELQRMLLISKSLVYEGASVKVIGSRGIHTRELHPDMKKIGHSKGIIYIYSSGSPFRNPNFLKRNMIKPFEKILELIIICRLNKKQKIDIAIITTMKFSHLLFYKTLSLIFGFKAIPDFVEYFPSMNDREGISFRINDYFFSRFAVRISDGVLVISEFLINMIKKEDPLKSYLKIPVLVDVDRYRGIERSLNEKYFIFCGAAYYKEVIFFIIKSFELIESDDTFLYLIINGDNEKLAEIKKRISISNKSKIIKLFSNLRDIELSILYKSAVGLLIPLRPTVQDEARFPHKFGEYLASGNPVITTNYGEAKYYLKDEVNALVAESYDEPAFADKMNYVLSNPADCALLGENGKKAANEFANYKIYGEKIINFVDEIEAHRIKSRDSNLKY